VHIPPNRAYRLWVPRTGLKWLQLYTRPHLYPARTGGHPVNKTLISADHKVTTQHYRTLYKGVLRNVLGGTGKGFNNKDNVHKYNVILRNGRATIVAKEKQLILHILSVFL
jgi:hypothetical protein